jgi:hypothetical protein
LCNSQNSVLQRPTSFTTDFLSEVVDPINWIPTARAGASLVSKIAPSLSPIKSRFAVGGADAFSVGYAQSELMVVNKGFMSEQETGSCSCSWYPVYRVYDFR